MWPRKYVVALLGTLVLAAGCTAWSKTPVPPPPAASQSLPDVLRIHLKDGRSLTLTHASIVGDSLVGVPEKAKTSRRHERYAEGREAVALADIQSVEKSHFNVPMAVVTFVIIAGVGVAAAAASIGNSL